jgi:hypothetical protein
MVFNATFNNISVIDGIAAAFTHYNYLWCCKKETSKGILHADYVGSVLR